jgi:hypothetical protein
MISFQLPFLVLFICQAASKLGVFFFLLTAPAKTTAVFTACLAILAVLALLIFLL